MINTRKNTIQGYYLWHLWILIIKQTENEIMVVKRNELKNGRSVIIIPFINYFLQTCSQVYLQAFECHVTKVYDKDSYRLENPKQEMP